MGQEETKESLRFDAKAGWIVALVALTLSAVGGMVSVSVRAGSLETRVGQVELRQNQLSNSQALMMDKLDSISNAVARIEGRLEKK